MFTFLKQYKTLSEKAFLALVIIALCQETLFIYPVALISHIGPLSAFSKIILPATYLVLTVLSLQGRAITRYVRVQDFYLILFFVVYVVVSSMLSPQQSQAISNVFGTEILPCIPFLLFGLCIRIDSISMDTIGKWSCLSVLVTSAYRLLYQDPSTDWEYEYNMGASYALLPNILITIDYAFRSKRIFAILGSAVGAFYLFAMGTRGPLIVMISLVLVDLLLFLKVRSVWKVFILVTLGILIVWMSFSSVYSSSMEMLGGLLSSLGLSTRVTDMAIAGEIISYTSGRNEIFGILTRHLIDMPFLGYGVLGENRFDILSAHNLYLQAIFDYGFLFGGLILLFLFYIVIKAFIKSRGTLSNEWLVLWATYVFIRGFFGGGILRVEVFILMGLSLRILRMEKQELR